MHMYANPFSQPTIFSPYVMRGGVENMGILFPAFRIMGPLVWKTNTEWIRRSVDETWLKRRTEERTGGIKGGMVAPRLRIAVGSRSSKKQHGGISRLEVVKRLIKLGTERKKPHTTRNSIKIKTIIYGYDYSLVVTFIHSWHFVFPQDKPLGRGRTFF